MADHPTILFLTGKRGAKRDPLAELLFKTRVG